MTVPCQFLRHIQMPWQVSLVGLTPCCTNHRTIKAEHLGVQNKVVQGQSKFSGTCHHSTYVPGTLDRSLALFVSETGYNLLTAPLPEGRSRLVVVASPVKSKGIPSDPFWAAAPRSV